MRTYMWISIHIYICITELPYICVYKIDTPILRSHACTYSYTDHVYSRKGISLPPISPFLFAYFFRVASNKSAKCILRRARYIWYSVPFDISCRFAFNLQRAGENAVRLTFTEELRFIGASVMSCVICTYITLVINEVE